MRVKDLIGVKFLKKGDKTVYTITDFNGMFVVNYRTALYQYHYYYKVIDDIRKGEWKIIDKVTIEKDEIFDFLSSWT